MYRLRQLLKKILPSRIVQWIRRRLAVRRYLKALSFEVLERETRLDDLEERVAARRDGFYERIVHEVLERTDLVLMQLDRRIEAQGARSAQRIEGLEEETARLRTAVEDLRAALGRDEAEEQERAVTHRE